MRVLILTCNTGGGHNAVAAALKEATARHREAARLFRALGQTAWRIVQEGVRSRPARSTGKSGEDRGRRRTGAKRSGS